LKRRGGKFSASSLFNFEEHRAADAVAWVTGSSRLVIRTIRLLVPGAISAMAGNVSAGFQPADCIATGGSKYVCAAADHKHKGDRAESTSQ
jgi:hypothetical protein